MGKMISLQSIAVAAAAAGLPAADEAKLFRFTLRHSLLLVAIVGLIAPLMPICFLDGSLEEGNRQLIV